MKCLSILSKLASIFLDTYQYLSSTLQLYQSFLRYFSIRIDILSSAFQLYQKLLRYFSIHIDMFSSNSRLYRNSLRYKRFCINTTSLIICIDISKSLYIEMFLERTPSPNPIIMRFRINKQY